MDRGGCGTEGDSVENYIKIFVSTKSSRNIPNFEKIDLHKLYSNKKILNGATKKMCTFF